MHARVVLRSLAAITLTLSLSACGDSDDGSAGTNQGTSDGGSESTTMGGASSDASSDASTSDATTTDTDATTTAGTTGTPGGAMGCDGATLLENPGDTSLQGPWPVGVRTVDIDGLTVEVWYPATPGTDGGVDPVVYDIRDALPDSEVGKVSDEMNPWQPCDCYRDLPIDSANGPFPGVVFVHGTAGFRSQSLEFMTHWASRGFIVMSADHPGLWLKDLLGIVCGQGMVPQNLTGDVNKMVSAFQTQTGGMDFLAGSADGGRIAMSGHSAGGGAIEGFGGVAQVLIPMASGGVSAGATLQSTLVLGAQDDMVVAYGNTKSGYDSSPAPKRLVGIAGTGHLAFSSLCSLQNEQGMDFLEIAEAAGVCGAQLAGGLFDCEDAYIDDEISWAISKYTSSAALESALHCSDAADNFATLEASYPDVGEFLEEL